MHVLLGEGNTLCSADRTEHVKALVDGKLFQPVNVIY